MAAPEIRYTLTEDGVRIAYQYIDGRDPVLFNPTVLGYEFAHTETNPAWIAYREALRGDNAFVIFDYRGAGLSGGYKGGVTISDFATDAEAVACTLGDRELILIPGMSGVGPAVEFVLRRPEGIRGMLLRAPSRSAYTSTLLAARKENLEDGMFLGTRAIYEWDDVEAIRAAVRDKARTYREREYWEAVAAYDAWPIEERLAQLDLPVIVTGGAEDREELSELAALIPGASLQLLPVNVVSRANGERARAMLEPWLDAGSPAWNVEEAVELTPRQREVLALIAAGLTNRDIAEELSVAPGTVARHVSEILGRLGLKNRTQIARYASERGLADESAGAREHRP